MKVPPSWLSHRVLSVEIIDPLEWVAYKKRKESDVFTFAQVGYPILPSDFISYDDIKISSLKYVIYLRKDDENGTEVSISKLSKFKFPIEDTRIQQSEMLASPQVNSNALQPSAVFLHHCYANPSEGRRWIKQAEVDFGMLEVNNSQAQGDHSLEGFGLVCFLSHQVCEKALKGGVYAICGKDARKINDHSLLGRAYTIQPRKPGLCLTSIIEHITPLEKYYLNTRYPNRWPKDNKIPAEHFTFSDANEAMASAKFVLEKVKEEIMPQT